MLFVEGCLRSYAGRNVCWRLAYEWPMLRFGATRTLAPVLRPGGRGTSVGVYFSSPLFFSRAKFTEVRRKAEVRGCAQVRRGPV
jgi:hypothetical protein